MNWTIDDDIQEARENIARIDRDYRAGDVDWDTWIDLKRHYQDELRELCNPTNWGG